MSVKILVGDMLERLREVEDCSVDSIVTDPPYELGFMGKKWDLSGVAFNPETWAECLRVAKPGAYLLSFGGTRTYHRMACAIEDAGWEIRDQIGWAFGSGFPKSHNGEWGGTALKPAWEPICMARKPLIGTVEQNWRQHGTGALNIDGCRIPVDAAVDDMLRTVIRGERSSETWKNGSGFKNETNGLTGVPESGRWPANLAHDGSDEVLAAFPSEAGAAAPVHRRNGDKFRTAYGSFAGNIDEAGSTFHGDTGSAARFFYCAKADRKDRDEGLDSSFAKKPLNWSSGEQSPGTFQSANTDRTARNHHPTVKPTALMRWLCRLVTPKGGIILDPFMGSGSTGKAAIREGFSFIGVELSVEYVEIAKRRIHSDAPLFAEVEGA